MNIYEGTAEKKMSHQAVFLSKKGKWLNFDDNRMPNGTTGKVAAWCSYLFMKYDVFRQNVGLFQEWKVLSLT